MRPDLTAFCDPCRTRVPARSRACPLCARKLKPVDGPLRRRRPAPLFPFKLLAYSFVLLGLLAALAAPLGTVGAIVALLMESPSDDGPLAAMLVAMVPFMVMSMVFAEVIVLGITGGIAALLMTLVFWIVIPSRGTRVCAYPGPAPTVPGGNVLLRGVRALAKKTHPYRSDDRIKRVGWFLFGIWTFVSSVFFAAMVGFDDICSVLFIGAFSGALFGAGWAAWLFMVLNGPHWMLDVFEPGHSDLRRARIGSPEDLLSFATETRGAPTVGVVRRAYEGATRAPTGDEALAWHLRGRSDGHEVDEADLASFLLETDDGAGVVVLRGDFTLIELHPDEAPAGAIDPAFWQARHLAATTTKLTLRTLEVGDRVEVHGTQTRVMDHAGGYRGGEMDALEGTLDHPLVVQRIAAGEPAARTA